MANSDDFLNYMVTALLWTKSVIYSALSIACYCIFCVAKELESASSDSFANSVFKSPFSDFLHVANIKENSRPYILFEVAISAQVSTYIFVCD